MLKEYAKRWDKKIKEWNFNPSEYFERDKVFKYYSGKDQRKLEKLAIPEPYLGDIEDVCSAVVLTLNPGPLLEKGEQLHPDGKFIKEGAVESYKEWAKKWYYLNETKNDFWNSKKKWIGRRQENKKLNPFGMELVPYHSKKYGALYKNPDLIRTLYSDVFEIAEEKLKDSSYEAIVAFGKDYYNIMKELDFKLLFEVDNNTLSDDLKNIWPRNSKGQFVNRSYSVWQSESGALYFQTHYQGGQKDPAKSFLGVEKYIEEKYISVY